MMNMDNVCVMCGAEFWSPMVRKYCHDCTYKRKCSAVVRREGTCTPTENVCHHCGMKYRPHNRNSRYCSECQQLLKTVNYTRYLLYGILMSKPENTDDALNSLMDEVGPELYNMVIDNSKLKRLVECNRRMYSCDARA